MSFPANAIEYSALQAADEEEILSHRHREDGYAGAISFGAFLILLAVFYLTNPSLLAAGRAFVGDFHLVQISQNFSWPEPSTNHPVLYNAAEQFCYVFSVVQLAVLALLFVQKSGLRGKARTFSSFIFWLGAGYAFGSLSSRALAWIPFLGVLIVVFGISIVIRSVILAVAFRH